eukprot:TRINITY_DN2787_c0_g1_i2.p1 TRINITY_DN2787_c0_g1~~TRINITY_DN2787_c0_g1_i2.p1  ORF type:complete len:932 (+),score=278.28 TRINITY_DN2787_c0_g1_i2:269-3064(+)
MSSVYSSSSESESTGSSRYSPASYTSTRGSTTRSQTMSGADQIDIPPPQERSGFLKVSTVIDTFVRNRFKWLGAKLADRPSLFIIGALVLAMVCGAGFTQFTVENRNERLWIPDNSEAIGQQGVVKEKFGTGFRIEGFIATTSSNAGSIAGAVPNNVLTRKAVQDAMAVHQRVTAVTAQADGKTWDLNALCFKQYAGGPCISTGLLEYWSFDPARVAAITSDAEVLNTVNNGAARGSFGNVLDPSTFLGGIRRDSNNRIISAEAFRITYFVTRDNERVVDGEPIDPPAENWELEYLKLGGDSQSLYLVMSADRSIPDAFSEAISGDLTLLAIGVFLIIIYTVLALGRFGNLVHSRMLVAVTGVLSVGLAIVSSYGLASFMGIFFSPVHSVLPFVLIGIGVDDMFILVAALDQQDDRKPLKDRFIRAMGEAGTAVTVTSLTDVVAFLVGASTSLPALRTFCLYAAFGILFDFLYQITFFAGFLVLDQRRQDAGRADCLPCIRLSGRDRESQLQRRREQGSTEEEKPNILKRIMPEYVGPFVASPVGAAAILVTFVALFSAGIYGATQIESEFEFSSFVPDDNPYQEYLKAQGRYFGEVPVPVNIYFVNIDHFQEQAKLTQMATAVQNDRWISSGSLTSWYEDYKAYAASNNIDLTTRASFEGNLRPFLSSSAGRKYESDVVFTSTTSNTIDASRIGATYIILENSSAEVDAMRSLRNAVSGVNLPGSFPFTFEYLFWEQYAVITREATLNLGLATMCVLIITVALLGHPGAALLVTSAVGFTILNLFGFSYYWNLSIDSVVVINAVIAIGLSVDYAAHVTHAFLARMGSARGRTIGAIGDTGVPVLNGAFSTFLAVVVLAFSQSFVFRIFFKMFFLVVVFGVFHGLFVVPVLNRYINWASAGHLPVSDKGEVVDGDPTGQEMKVAKSITDIA